MQGINSLGQTDHQIQNQPSMHHFGNNDDFLDQMLSSVLKSPWDVNNSSGNDSPFHFDEPTLLASKLRQHQISSKTLLHHQLLAGIPDVNPSSFTTPNQGGDGSAQALYNGFSGAAQALNQSEQHHRPQGSGTMQQQTYGQPVSQSPASGGGSAPAQPRQRVRARRGQATDPHSIAERLRRERIAERMKGLQELVPNANKTDKASMLDEIIDYVKFLQLQVKVLSMSRLGGAAVADIASEGGGGDCVHGGNQPAAGKDSLTVTEHQVAKLMEEDMGSAMQYLQGKGLCLMPISLATAISTSTRNHTHILASNTGDAPSSPGMSVLTVLSAHKDAASVSKP